MRQFALQYPGDDLHVPVSVRINPLAGCTESSLFTSSNPWWVFSGL